MQQAILQVLDLAADPACIIDSLPVPVVRFYCVPQATADWKAASATVGPCYSNKQAIFGYTLHLLLTQSGVSRDVELAPATVTDLVAGTELVARHRGLWVVADNA